MAPYLGLDVGATNTRAAVADTHGAVLGRSHRQTPSGPDGAAITDAVCEAARRACREASVDPDAIERAAVATVAEIDRARGGIVDPANFPDEIDYIPVVEPLSELLGANARDVVLLNDATAGALGEWAHEDGQIDDLVYLSMSTGIGAGAFVDGNLLDGHGGNAAEVGHVTLDPEGRMTCGCGSDGHWEAYCSGANVPRYARHLAETEGIPTDLSLDDLVAADVFETPADPLSARLIEHIASWNAQGVAMIACVYDPEVISVGGAVALSNPDRVVDPVRERLGEHLPFPPPELRLTPVGEDVVLYGAIERATDCESNVDPGQTRNQGR